MIFNKLFAKKGPKIEHFSAIWVHISTAKYIKVIFFVAKIKFKHCSRA